MDGWKFVALGLIPLLSIADRHLKKKTYILFCVVVSETFYAYKCNDAVSVN